jgi:hypothetical protein
MKSAKTLIMIVSALTALLTFAQQPTKSVNPGTRGTLLIEVPQLDLGFRNGSVSMRHGFVEATDTLKTDISGRQMESRFLKMKAELATAYPGIESGDSRIGIVGKPECFTNVDNVYLDYNERAQVPGTVCYFHGRSRYQWQIVTLTLIPMSATTFRLELQLRSSNEDDYPVHEFKYRN